MSAQGPPATPMRALALALAAVAFVRAAAFHTRLAPPPGLLSLGFTDPWSIADFALGEVALLALATDAWAGLPASLALGRALRRAADEDPAWTAGALVVVAAAYRLAVGALHHDGTFHGTLIQGMPYSDGADWHNLASDLARGERAAEGPWSLWSGRRPGYYLLLGAIYAIAGESLRAAWMAQMMMGAASAALVFDAARRCCPYPVAVLATIVHASLSYDALAALTTMSEPAGYFLSNAALWCLVIAATGASGSRAFGLALAGGALLGAANLTRTLNVGATPILALVAGVIHARRTARRRDGAVVAAAFAVGLVLVLTPWLVRQRLVHGITALSDNGGEAMFAATHPDYVEWTSRVSPLPQTSDIGARSRFYEEEVKKNLAAHWRFYLRNALGHAFEHVIALAPPPWFFAVGAVLFVAAGPGDLRRRAWIGAGWAALAYLAGQHRLWVVWLMGAGIAALRLHPMALLVALVAPTVASLGAIAMAADPRFVHGQLWLTAALAAWAQWLLCAWLAGERPTTAPAVVPPWGRAALAPKVALGVALTALAAGFIRMALVNRRPPPHAALERALEPARAGAWLDDLVAGPGARWADLRARLVIEQAAVRPEFVARFDAGEDVGHPTSLFAPRPYPFTLFQTRPRLRSAPFAACAGVPPLDGVVVVAGLIDEGNDALEVIAVGRVTPTGVAWSLPPPEVAAAHEAHVRGRLNLNR